MSRDGLNLRSPSLCALRVLAEGQEFVRTALTLIAALDRARDAMSLSRRALALHSSDRWVFVPTEVAARSLTALTEALVRRHRAGDFTRCGGVAPNRRVACCRPEVTVARAIRVGRATLFC